MNYRFRQAANGFARQRTGRTRAARSVRCAGTQVAHSLKAILEDYPPQACRGLVQPRRLARHEPRRCSCCTESGDSVARSRRQRQQLVALLQFTSFGAPMVYYGDEAGIDAPGTQWLRRSVQPRAVSMGGRERERRHVRAGGAVHARPGTPGSARCGRLAGVRGAASFSRDSSRTTTCLAFGRVGAPNKPVIVALNKGAQAAAVGFRCAACIRTARSSRMHSAARTSRRVKGA